MMPEIKSEVRIEWQDGKTKKRGTIAIRGQHVVFMHKQVEYSLHWKQEAVLFCFCADDGIFQWRTSGQGTPLLKVSHSPMWELARHDCGILEIIRLLVESVYHIRPAYPARCYEHFCAALGFLLVDALMHRNEMKNAPATMDAERLRRILDYINQNLHEKIVVKTLATTARLSRTHFKQLFKATTGMSARDYIFKERIRKAQALLRHGGLRIAEIATLCGFCDQSHLDRCFRRYCQCSPSDFLKQCPIVPKNSPSIQCQPKKTGHTGATL